MDLAEPAVFFGDETSFAAAKTLQAHLAPSHATRLVFEISSTAEAKKVAERLELRDFEFFEKRDDGPHISGVARALQRSMDYLATPHLVLTGNGRSIQAVRGALRTAMNPYDWNAILCRDKAYWAPGKSNLD
jgi:NADPH-dependent ferric siderophore reductase